MCRHNTCSSLFQNNALLPLTVIITERIIKENKKKTAKEMRGKLPAEARARGLPGPNNSGLGYRRPPQPLSTRVRSFSLSLPATGQ